MGLAFPPLLVPLCLALVAVAGCGRNRHQAKSRGMDPEKVQQGPDAWDAKVREGVTEWVKQAFEAYAKLPAPQPRSHATG